jgi:hypothetical protein
MAFLKRKEREIKRKKERWLINTESKFKTIWDHFQIILIIYLSTASPFKLSFFEEGDYPAWDIAEYVIDVFIFIDIILTFFTPIWVRHELINCHKQIAKEYLSFWFWIDFLSIIPLAEIIIWLKLSNSAVAGVSNIPRFYRLFKLSKLVRAVRMQKKGDTYVGRMLNKFRKSDTLLGNVLPLYVFGILVAYIFACIWFFIPKINPDRSGWILRYGYDGEATHDKFWASMYYVYSTVTTTGYGDIVPNNTQEFSMTLLFMVAGVTFYSMIYTIIIRRIEKHAERFNEFWVKRNFLNEFRRKKRWLKTKRGKKIYTEMKVVLDEAYNLHIEKEEIPEFKNVRPTDVTNLHLEVCERSFRFDKIKFFNDLPHSKWLQFYENMEKRMYNPGDYIY